MTLRSIPQWSSQLIEQACKRSKKKAFHFYFSDLSSGQQYTFFYSTNTSHAWNELKEEGGQGGNMKELHVNPVACSVWYQINISFL